MTNESTSDEIRPLVPKWTLVTSHGLVLLYVALHGNPTIRNMAESLELTERRIASIIRDLETTGLMQVTKVGRRNFYALDSSARFRHPFVAGIPFVRFLELWQQAARDEGTRSD